MARIASEILQKCARSFCEAAYEVKTRAGIDVVVRIRYKPPRSRDAAQASVRALGWRGRLAGAGGYAERDGVVGGAYRLMYVAKFTEGIYVLHVFQKKSQKTAAMDIELARGRLKAVRRARVEE